MKDRTLKVISVILFILLFLIDGQVTALFRNIFHAQLLAVSGLLLIALLISTQRLNHFFLVVTSFVIGYLMDTYYIGILGINMVILPISVYYIYKFRATINQNIFTQLFGTIIFVTIYQTSEAIIQGIFQLAKIDPVTFIAQLLGPTLLVNIIFFFIVVVPLKKLYLTK